MAAEPEGLQGGAGCWMWLLLLRCLWAPAPTPLPLRCCFHSSRKAPSPGPHKSVQFCFPRGKRKQISFKLLKTESKQQIILSESKNNLLSRPCSLPHPRELRLLGVNYVVPHVMPMSAQIQFNSAFNHYFHTYSWHTGKLSVVGYFYSWNTEFNPFSLPQ